jgi:hypothetical protein
MGWWTFTRQAIELLTNPRADIGAADRAVLDLARDTRLGVALHAMSHFIREAWQRSYVRAAMRQLHATLTPGSGAAVFRLRGWMALVAGATVLGLDALKPVPVAPFTAVVPLVVIAVGILTMIGADPLARARADRQSRTAGR